MRSLILSISLWVGASLGTVALAQQTEPDSVQIEAARRAIRAERDAERLQLTDAWLTYEDAQERDRLELQLWVHGIGLGAFGALWAGLGFANESGEGPLSLSVMTFGSAAVSLALLTGVILIDDDRDQARFAIWSWVTEFALIGTGLLVAMADLESSNSQVLHGAFAAQAYVYAATLAVLSLIYPPLFISEHYDRYRAAPDGERAKLGLDLLLERERRERAATYLGFGLGVAQAGTYALAAVQAERSRERTTLWVVGGVFLVNALANLIVQLVQRTPSESILGGFPPPSEAAADL